MKIEVDPVRQQQFNQTVQAALQKYRLGQRLVRAILLMLTVEIVPCGRGQPSKCVNN